MVSVENIFYCRLGDEPVAIVTESDNKKCPDCDKDMINIGWMETDGREKDLDG